MANPKNQHSRKQKRNQNLTGAKQEEGKILASAIIKEGRDTDILQEDLIREFQPDRFDSDQSLLVNNEWVRFFDRNSSFLKGLMALVMNSTTLRNALNRKTSMTLGDGFIPFESSSVPFLVTVRRLLKKILASNSDIEQMNELIGSVNTQNESLAEVMQKVVFDWYAFGNCMVELVKTTKEGQPIVYMNHIPLHKTGIKKVDPKTNVITTIGVSNNWEIDQGAIVTELPVYPEFNDDGRSVIHVKNYAPGFFYWGLPSNIAGRFWAELEYRIPKYNITKFKNGFVPSAIIQMFGQMSPEEAQLMAQKFESCFTDTGRNNKIWFQVLSNEKYKANVETLEDKSDGNYMDLSKLGSQAIITANEWTMSLGGFATGGKLGTNQQIRDEIEFVKNTSLKQVQRLLEQKIINPFIKENQEVGAAPQGVMLKIAQSNPVSLSSQLDPKMVLTANEQREILGFDQVEEDLAQQMQDDEEQPQSE